jgi:hypothetical protein
MNPKLKSTSANPAAARFGATVKATLDHDLVFIGRPGREVEAREVAVEMPELFMTSDRDLRECQELGQKSLFESRENLDKRPPDEWARSGVRNYEARS